MIKIGAFRSHNSPRFRQTLPRSFGYVRIANDSDVNRDMNRDRSSSDVNGPSSQRCPTTIEMSAVKRITLPYFPAASPPPSSRPAGPVKSGAISPGRYSVVEPRQK